jgi:hypothetical protein
VAADFLFPDLGRLRQLIDILVIGVCCLDCGGAGFTDTETFGLAQRRWLSTVLELPNGIPSHDTYNRVFAAIDPRAFMDCLSAPGPPRTDCPRLGQGGRQKQRNQRHPRVAARLGLDRLHRHDRQTVDAGHGRVETRRCWCTSDIA